jgi:predicted phosphodiesterase
VPSQFGVSPHTRLVTTGVLVAGLLAAACSSAPNEEVDRPPDRVKGAGVTFSPLRFAVVGDAGSGLPVQYRVARRMCSWRKHHRFHLVFTTGDNIYDHGEPSRFAEAFFNPYACLLNNGARFHATLGNHDDDTLNGRPQVVTGAFGYKNEHRNYVIRKKGVRFVVVNATDLRRRWLRRRTRAQAGDRWTIVIFHYPVYSSGGYETYSDWRTWMPDLFERRGVDLVLNGHDHVYSVTRRLDGIRYVVTGGGGAPLYACHDRWYAATCRSRHHFLSVVARRHTLSVKAIPRSGDPFHSFRTRGRGPR